MQSLYAFLNIQDYAISAFVATLNKQSQEYKIIARKSKLIDQSETSACFIKNQAVTESAIAELINNLENEIDDQISKIVIVLPDSCFEIKKNTRHNKLDFKKSPSPIDIFKIKKESWEIFESNKNNNEITDIETIGYLNKNGDIILNPIAEEMETLISISSASYLKHEYIDKINSISRNLNLNKSLIIPQSYAYSYGLMHKNNTADTYLAINITHLETTASIISNIGTDYTTSIPYGVYSITLDLAKKFDLSTRNASKILNLYLQGFGHIEYSMISNLDIKNRALLNKTIIKGIESILQIVHSSLESSGFKKEITKIIIDGEISHLDYIRNLSKEIFDKPTYLVNFDKELKDEEFDIEKGAIKKLFAHNKEISEIQNYSMQIKNILHKVLRSVALKINNIL